jgi:electron transfer flavoprotein alpha subunit
MDKVLFLAHTESDGSLAKAALEGLRAALALASESGSHPLTVGLIGEHVQKAADCVGSCGARKFLGVTGPAFAASRYATDAAAAEAIARTAEATIVIAAGTSRWARVLPGVAARLNGRADTHVTGLSSIGGAPAIHRWFYRQRMEAVMQRTHRPWFILVEPGAFPAWAGASTPVTVESVNVAVPDAGWRTKPIGLKAPPADEQTIRPDADLLFVTGAGWTKKQADGQSHVKEAEQIILNFLRRARASLGSSKSLVDLGSEGQAVLSFLTHLNQIGQTGATPRHAKGLATCCHGEEPHTVGWRFVNERRAVNLDPNCGWARGKADVLYVADAFAVMRKVNELLGGK